MLVFFFNTIKNAHTLRVRVCLYYLMWKLILIRLQVFACWLTCWLACWNSSEVSFWVSLRSPWPLEQYQTRVGVVAWAWATFHVRGGAAKQTYLRWNSELWNPGHKAKVCTVGDASASASAAASSSYQVCICVCQRFAKNNNNSSSSSSPKTHSHTHSRTGGLIKQALLIFEDRPGQNRTATAKCW